MFTDLETVCVFVTMYQCKDYACICVIVYEFDIICASMLLCMTLETLEVTIGLT